LRCGNGNIKTPGKL